jgi:beta-N-acetylhexosaminidase
LRFSGAVFSDDLSMRGASVIGSMPDRVRTALAAGCDMTPICNDRAAVASVLSALSPPEGWLDPVAQMRLARMRGTQAPDRGELLTSAKWKECAQAAQRCLERPSLVLS